MSQLPEVDNNLAFSSISKYYGDQNPLYGGKLHWPGIQGLPFRGDTAPLMSEEDKSRVYAAGDANHATLDLSDDSDSKLYAWIRDRIKNGLFVLDHIERHWNENTKNVIVYIEWTQLYTQIRGTS